MDTPFKERSWLEVAEKINSVSFLELLLTCVKVKFQNPLLDFHTVSLSLVKS